MSGFCSTLYESAWAPMLAMKLFHDNEVHYVLNLSYGDILRLVGVK